MVHREYFESLENEKNIDRRMSRGLPSSTNNKVDPFVLHKQTRHLIILSLILHCLIAQQCGVFSLASTHLGRRSTFYAHSLFALGIKARRLLVRSYIISLFRLNNSWETNLSDRDDASNISVVDSSRGHCWGKFKKKKYSPTQCDVCSLTKMLFCRISLRYP